MDRQAEMDDFFDDDDDQAELRRRREYYYNEEEGEEIEQDRYIDVEQAKGQVYKWIQEESTRRWIRKKF